LQGISTIFTQSMMNLLDYFKTLTGSYGWSIIIFATLIKLALYLPTQSQYKSMKAMQRLQPHLKKLQDKYKNDPQKMQIEQMALFKENKVNPLGGCLPILIQMPILIGIFVTIKKMAELGKFAGETFLWIGGPLSKTYSWIGGSLAEKDIPLLIIYGISMYLSQKISMTDPAQEKTQQMMNIIMPVAFTFILMNFPSSLILYWLVFNIWSILHQYLVMKSKDPEDLTPAAVSAGAGGKDLNVLTQVSGSGALSTERIKSRSRKKKGGK